MKKKSLKERILLVFQENQGVQTKKSIALIVDDTEKNVGRRLSDLFNAGKVKRNVNLKTRQLEYFTEEVVKKKVVKPKKTVKKSTGKKPVQSPKKKAPSKEFINPDGSINYSKMTKLKRADVVRFEHQKKELFGVVLYADWDFWQSKCYLRIAANGTVLWKLHSKVSIFEPSSDIQKKEMNATASKVLEKHKVPKFTEWKRELCLNELTIKGFA